MIRWASALIPIVAVCAGCASAISGTPATDSTAPKLPQRPRELRIDGLDPCSTLTTAQVRTLRVQYFTTDQPDVTRGPGCEWVHSPSEPIETYSVDINTRGGVELTFDQRQLEVTTIAGFGAVTTPGLYSAGDRDCIVNVDVASRQAVQIGYFYRGSTVPMNHEIACRKARNAAELAMQTIQAKIGG
jgi:Protein of unknown function (DUF3558)